MINILKKYKYLIIGLIGILILCLISYFLFIKKSPIIEDSKINEYEEVTSNNYVVDEERKNELITTDTKVYKCKRVVDTRETEDIYDIEKIWVNDNRVIQTSYWKEIVYKDDATYYLIKSEEPERIYDDNILTATFFQDRIVDYTKNSDGDEMIMDFSLYKTLTDYKCE